MQKTKIKNSKITLKVRNVSKTCTLYGLQHKDSLLSDFFLSWANGKPWQKIGKREENEVRMFMTSAPSLLGLLKLALLLNQRSLFSLRQPAIYIQLSPSFLVSTPFFIL